MDNRFQMDGEQKGWAWLVGCMAIVLSILIGSVTYYYTEKDAMKERLVMKALEKGISPAVLKCVDTHWETTATYNICMKVLSSRNMSREEAAKLAERLGELDR